MPSPDITQLPGGGTFKDLTNGLGGFVLVALLFGLLVACGSWALGIGIGNIQLAERGKQGATAVFLIALLVGASAILLGFFYGVGQKLHEGRSPPLAPAAGGFWKGMALFGSVPHTLPATGIWSG